MRVYLAATLTTLAAALEAGEFGPAPLRAWAVTPRLREWFAEADLEELEYAAANEAALGSLRLLAALPGRHTRSSRRVVVAADVPESAVAPDASGTRAAVSLSERVPWQRVASVHIDDVDAAPDVAAAALVVAEADDGDEDAAFVVGGAEAHELMWYAAQEIAELLEHE